MCHWRSAEEILARPAFTLSGTKTDVELFTVSAAELGFKKETASLRQIYARARQLGFGLAAAEIAPQLSSTFSRSVNFSSSEWSRSKHGRASP